MTRAAIVRGVPLVSSVDASAGVHRVKRHMRGNTTYKLRSPSSAPAILGYLSCMLLLQSVNGAAVITGPGSLTHGTAAASKAITLTLDVQGALDNEAALTGSSNPLSFLASGSGSIGDFISVAGSTKWVSAGSNKYTLQVEAKQAGHETITFVNPSDILKISSTAVAAGAGHSISVGKCVKI